MGQEEHHQSEHHSATPAAFSQGHTHSQLSAGAVRQDLASEAYFCMQFVQSVVCNVSITQIAHKVCQYPGGRKGVT